MARCQKSYFVGVVALSVLGLIYVNTYQQDGARENQIPTKAEYEYVKSSTLQQQTKRPSGLHSNNSVVSKISGHHETDLPLDKHKVKTKLILAYTSIYGNKFTVGYPGKSANQLDICKYKCKWSTDKQDYNKSDAVIFHLFNRVDGLTDFNISQLPTRYSLDQRWILMAREPQALYYPEQLKLLNDKFNLTMTFQRDSDVSIPYGRYYKLHQLRGIQQKRPKNKMVAWLVSNCVTSSRRESYVKELQNYIDVDVYGRCGKSKKKTSEGVRSMIATNYNFYLAFENSDCDDYITEKFWMNFNNLIPIVRGQRAGYETATPPDSFINADSFAHPQKLAEYLRKVVSNQTLYDKYHQWKRSYSGGYRFFTVNTHWRCDLCEQVHTSKPKTVNIYEHFSEDTRCTAHREIENNRTGERMHDLYKQKKIRKL